MKPELLIRTGSNFIKKYFLQKSCRMTWESEKNFI